MQGEDGPAIVGIDVGTQSVRAIAFDGRGRQLAAARRPTPARMLDGARGDYDPDTLFAAVIACLGEVAAGLGGRPVAGMAVASVGESCVIIDAAGRPLAPAPVWFDRRSEPAAAALTDAIGIEHGFALTGCQIDFTFSLCKLGWMRQAMPEAFAAARHVLCIADWIAYRLCGVAATDFTLASRTFYLDIHRRCWSEELLALIGRDAGFPAALVPSGTRLGPVLPQVLAETGLAGRPEVGAGGHDHLVGAFAVGVNRPGILLDSMGTAEAMRLVTEEPIRDLALLRSGFVQTAMATNRPLFSFGAGLNSSGGAIEWFRALAGEPPHEVLVAEAEAVPPGSHGALFLPHLAASPPPEFDASARGAFVGLTANASRGALYRAVLEGLAMQAQRMLKGMVGMPGAAAPKEIRAIGGNARNDLLMHIKANAYSLPIVVVDEPEATALGAALLGGIAGGLWEGLDQARSGLDRREHLVEPEPALCAYYGALEEEVFDGLQDILRPVNRRLAGFGDPRSP